jgi:hypothetical protein
MDLRASDKPRGLRLERAESALRTASGKEGGHILSKALVGADAHTSADLSDCETVALIKRGTQIGSIWRDGTCAHS